MSLPFRPQSIDELRGRYKRALVPWFDCRGERARRLRPRPGELYCCIFDFVTGLRLIISREQYDNRPGEWLHLAAGVLPDTPLVESLKDLNASSSEFCLIALSRFSDIADSPSDSLEFWGYSDAGNPHWGRQVKDGAP